MIAYNPKTKNFSHCLSENYWDVPTSAEIVDILNNIPSSTEYPKNSFIAKIKEFCLEKANGKGIERISLVNKDNMSMVKIHLPEKKFVCVKASKLFAHVYSNMQKFCDESNVLIDFKMGVFTIQKILVKNFNRSDYKQPVVKSCMTHDNVDGEVLRFYEAIGAKFITDEKNFRCLAIPTLDDKFFIRRIYTNNSALEKNILAALTSEFGFLDHTKIEQEEIKIDISNIDFDLTLLDKKLYIDGMGHGALDIDNIKCDKDKKNVFLSKGGEKLDLEDILKFRTSIKIVNNLLENIVKKEKEKITNAKSRIEIANAEIIQIQALLDRIV